MLSKHPFNPFCPKKRVAFMLRELFLFFRNTAGSLGPQIVIKHNKHHYFSRFAFLWNIYYHFEHLLSWEAFSLKLEKFFASKKQNESTKAMNEKWRFLLYYVFCAHSLFLKFLIIDATDVVCYYFLSSFFWGFLLLRNIKGRELMIYILRLV